MKLLTINQARAIWLFTLSDLNPRGRTSEKSALIEIGNRYKFAVSPNQVDLVVAREKNQPLKYLQGSYAPRKGEAVTIDLLLYRDGIVADTRSTTEDSHAFIDDLLTWAHSEFGLLPHEDIVRNKYSVSDVHVSSEYSLSVLHPKLANFSKAITGSARIPGADFELGAIGFWPEQKLPYQPIPFRFERAEGYPFSEKRYYSQAPMDTDSHLSLLDKLEALLR